jgi:single-strand DNA-binding protein
MSASVNKVILIGNLGADPELRTFQDGSRVATFNIATSESWKDKDSGERQERTQWTRIAVYAEPLVKIAEAYMKKGSKVFIEGQLETRKWDDNGEDRYVTEVALRPYRGEITLLDAPKRDREPSPDRPEPSRRRVASARSTAG